MAPSLQSVASTVLGGEFSRDLFWLLDTALPTAERVLTEQRLSKAPGMFMLMTPGEVFSNHPTLLLRPHFEELCKRYKAGEDTRPGTKAEVLAGLLGASLRSPLTNTANALINKLGVEVLGQDFEIPHHEGYPGQVDEAFRDCQRILSQPS